MARGESLTRRSQGEINLTERDSKECSKLISRYGVIRVLSWSVALNILNIHITSRIMVCNAWLPPRSRKRETHMVWI